MTEAVSTKSVNLGAIQKLKSIDSLIGTLSLTEL